VFTLENVNEKTNGSSFTTLKLKVCQSRDEFDAESHAIAMKVSSMKFEKNLMDFIELEATKKILTEWNGGFEII
jgi:hypothetical protein